MALGVVSFLTDVSSEMIFPLLPAFLAARVGSAPLLLGVMEGVADLVSAFFKIWAGRWADSARRLRPMVFLGYGLSTFARPWMGLIGAWWQPLAIRFVDRVGKGLRTSPRDAMLAHWVEEGGRAEAFSFHRGMDHAGAAAGALLATGLVAAGFELGTVFLLSSIPGLLGIGAIFFADEPTRAPSAGPAGARPPVPRRLGYFLGPVGLFSLAHASDGFFMLKLAEQGAPTAVLPVVWLALNLVRSFFSVPAGRLADKVGPHKVASVGWGLYCVSFLVLGLSGSLAVSIGAMLLSGLHRAAAEGSERAILVSLVPAEARGTALGLYHGLSGIGSLLCGLWFGLLWNQLGSTPAFLVAGGVALVSTALFVALLPLSRPRE